MRRIEIAAETGPRPAPRPSARVGSAQSRLNDHLAIVLGTLIALVPLPFGSNRAFFWGVTALFVGTAGIWYLLALSRTRESLRYPASRLWPSFVLFVLLCTFIVIQTLPIVGELQRLFPAIDFAVPTGSGQSIDVPTFSLAPYSTWLMLLRWVTYGLFFLLMLQASVNRVRKATLLNVVLAVITAYAAYGIASLFQFGDTVLGIPKWAYQGYATGPFINRNSFATFLAFGCAISLSLAVSRLVGDRKTAPHRSKRFGPRLMDPALILYIVSLVTVSVALLATQSRMGTTAATVGCMLVLVLTLSRAANRGIAALLVLPLLSGGIVALAYVYGQGLVERLGSVEQNLDVRLDLYVQVLQMIGARPLLGYGGGAFELAYPLFHQPPVSPDLVWDKAHNTYLALWAELGIVFGSIPVVLFVAAFRRILANVGGPDGAIAIAGLGAITVAAVHSLTDFSLEIEANVIILLAVVAVATPDVRRADRSKGTR